MIERKTRRCVRTRIQSQEERELREYHADVRKFKNWCNENNVTYHTFDDADNLDYCVLSRNEYDLHDVRRCLVEDHESYFLNLEDYEKWCEEFATDVL